MSAYQCLQKAQVQMMDSVARRKAVTIGFAADGVLCGIAAHAQGTLATMRLTRWLIARVSANDLLLIAMLFVAAAVIVVTFLAEMDVQAAKAAESVKDAAGVI